MFLHCSGYASLHNAGLKCLHFFYHHLCKIRQWTIQEFSCLVIKQRSPSTSLHAGAARSFHRKYSRPRNLCMVKFLLYLIVVLFYLFSFHSWHWFTKTFIVVFNNITPKFKPQPTVYIFHYLLSSRNHLSGPLSKETFILLQLGQKVTSVGCFFCRFPSILFVSVFQGSWL